MHLCGLVDNLLIKINKSLEDFLQEILLMVHYKVYC